MPTPLSIGGLKAATIHDKINLLIQNLVNITDTTGEFLLQLDDGRTIDTKGWNDWEWTHGIGLYGLYQYYALTGSPEPLEIIKEWFSHRFAEGTTKNINTMAPLLTLAYVYEQTKDQSYLPWLNEWAEWAMHDLPRTRGGGMQHMTYSLENHNEIWDDTLMMTVLPLTKIGKLLDRPHYIEEAKRQFLFHFKYLLDVKTGLFYHGWKFDEKAEGGVGHNFGNARWARGNSWLTIAIPDFVELLDLPGGDVFREHLLETLQMQCLALQRLQSKDGMWRTLLDVPQEKGSYGEASATAGFAYGMLKSIRKRYISNSFLPSALKAVEAVLARISEPGELQDVSFGTAVGYNLQHYLDIPQTSMPYGQAMAIMMLIEVLYLFI